MVDSVRHRQVPRRKEPRLRHLGTQRSLLLRLLALPKLLPCLREGLWTHSSEGGTVSFTEARCH